MRRPFRLITALLMLLSAFALLPSAQALAASSPAHAGAHSIAVTYGAWQGLFLHHPGVGTSGFAKLRFFIHGGSAGGQQINLYAVRAARIGLHIVRGGQHFGRGGLQRRRNERS